MNVRLDAPSLKAYTSHLLTQDTHQSDLRTDEYIRHLSSLAVVLSPPGNDCRGVFSGASALHNVRCCCQLFAECGNTHRGGPITAPVRASVCSALRVLLNTTTNLLTWEMLANVHVLPQDILLNVTIQPLGTGAVQYFHLLTLFSMRHKFIKSHDIQMLNAFPFGFQTHIL